MSRSPTKPRSPVVVLPIEAFLAAAGWSFVAYAPLTLMTMAAMAVVLGDLIFLGIWLTLLLGWAFLLLPLMGVAALLAVLLRRTPRAWHTPIFGLVFFMLAFGVWSLAFPEPSGNLGSSLFVGLSAGVPAAFARFKVRSYESVEWRPDDG